MGFVDYLIIVIGCGIGVTVFYNMLTEGKKNK